MQSWNNWEKDPIKQLEASKSSVKDLCSNILNEKKGFKYQITLKFMLKYTNQMEKLNLDQFISIQQKKTVINHKFSLKNAFQEICTGLITGLMKDLAGLLN